MCYTALTLNASGNTSSFSKNDFSLLIQISDFDTIIEKIGNETKHENLKKYIIQGYDIYLTVDNNQGDNNKTFKLKQILQKLNLTSESHKIEIEEQLESLTKRIKEQTNKIENMQIFMNAYTLKDYREADDFLSKLEGEKIELVTKKHDYIFIEETTDKIFNRLSEYMFDCIKNKIIDKSELLYQPLISDEMDKLLNYIFGDAMVHSVISSEFLLQNSLSYSDLNLLKEDVDNYNKIHTEEAESDSDSDSDSDSETEEEDLSNLDLEEEYKFYKNRCCELEKELEDTNKKQKEQLKKLRAKNKKFRDTTTTKENKLCDQIRTLLKTVEDLKSRVNDLECVEESLEKDIYDLTNERDEQITYAKDNEKNYFLLQHKLNKIEQILN